MNLVPKLSTSSKGKPAEEEPQVINDTVKITQDDVDISTENVHDTEDDTAVEAKDTAFTEDVNEDYVKTVNTQHYLLNPCTTKEEHVTKLQEAREQEAATGTAKPVKVTAKLPTKLKLPPAPETPVPKPTAVDSHH